MCKWAFSWIFQYLTKEAQIDRRNTDILWAPMKNLSNRVDTQEDLQEQKKKKYLLVLFGLWVDKNGWCSLSPWIVCHSHYFLPLPFPLSRFWESVDKNGCIFTNKRQKKLVLPIIIGSGWDLKLQVDTHTLTLCRKDHFLLELQYNPTSPSRRIVHVVRTKKYTVFLNICALKPIQCAHTMITLIKTRFCPHVHNNIHSSSTAISVSFSSLFWAQLASLFYLSVSLSGCWALVFYTAGLSLPTALFMDSMDHTHCSALIHCIPKTRGWQISHLYSPCLGKG